MAAWIRGTGSSEVAEHAFAPSAEHPKASWKEGHPPPPNLVAFRADKKPTRTSTAEMGPKGSSGGPIFEYLAQSIASEVQSEHVRRTCSARTSRSIDLYSRRVHSKFCLISLVGRICAERVLVGRW